MLISIERIISNLKAFVEDGRGVGGHGVHLSPWIRQEYTFIHNSICRTPAESSQENLTRGKEYIEPRRLRRKKDLGGKNRSVSSSSSSSRTGPALSGWGN